MQGREGGERDTHTRLCMYLIFYLNLYYLFRFIALPSAPVSERFLPLSSIVTHAVSRRPLRAVPIGRHLGVHGLYRWDLLQLDGCGSCVLYRVCLCAGVPISL